MVFYIVLLSLLCSVIAWNYPTLTSPLGPVVNLGYAAYAGNNTSPAGDGDTSVTFFGNIPYAQPPLGDLRFRAPRQLDESLKNGGWVDVVDARTWGLPCIQQPGNATTQTEGEPSLCVLTLLTRRHRLSYSEHMEAQLGQGG